VKAGVPSFGAYHSAEIIYVFGQLDSEAHAWAGEHRDLSALMRKYWANFARRGDPNGPGLPVWPAYSAAGRWPLLHLDTQVVAGPDEGRDRYLFLSSVWEK